MALIEQSWPNQVMIDRMKTGLCPHLVCSEPMHPAPVVMDSLEVTGSCRRHGAYALMPVFGQTGVYALIRFDQRHPSLRR